MAGDDNFEKQAAAMAAPPPKKWVNGVRTFAYAFVFFLIFGLACGELGITSDQLQKYGNLVTRYPNQETKHVIGLYLFNSIFTLLLCLGGAWLPLYFFSFLLFSASTIWIVGAGILEHQIPWSTSCGNRDSVGAPWNRFGDDCHEYIAMEALGWTNWALMLIVAVVVFVDAFKAKEKRHFVFGN
ncbi:hypothetical protein JCM5296_002854 [Sporobolomyces johnsonii]